MKCPNCKRNMDEREIDWTMGICRICTHEETEEELKCNAQIVRKR